MLRFLSLLCFLSFAFAKDFYEKEELFKDLNSTQKSHKRIKIPTH